VCDKEQNLGIISVESIETQRWQFDYMALVNALNPAFNGRTPRMVAEQRLWQVGHYHEQPVFLMCGINWHDANTILQQHAFSVQQGIILCLTPAKNPPAMPCIALWDVCSIKVNGSIKVDVEALAGFLPSQALAQSRYSFHHTGQHWRIIYAGKEATFKDSVGFSYISFLLSQPKQIFRAEALQSTRANIHNNTLLSLEDKENFFSDHLPQAIDDNSIFAKLKANVEDLRERQADSEAIANAEEALLEALKNKGRTFTDTGERARNQVRQAINRAIKNIDKHLPACAQHLQNNIKMGYDLTYNPSEIICWQ
jgi:hypothetical protein